LFKIIVRLQFLHSSVRDRVFIEAENPEASDLAEMRKFLVGDLGEADFKPFEAVQSTKILQVVVIDIGMPQFQCL